MNHMEEVCELLGVKLNEEFKIVEADNGEEWNGVFKILRDGLKEITYSEKTTTHYISPVDGLEGLLTGDLKIKKLPWKPSDGSRYYYVTPNKMLDHTVFDSSCYWDFMAYALGNCFRTIEEITPEILEKTWQKCYRAYFQGDKQDGVKQ